MLSAPTFADFSKAHELTLREQRIAELMIQGKTYPEMSKVLGLKAGTIKNAMRIVYLKLGIDGDKCTKKILLLLGVQEWLKQEKHRRIRARIDA